MVNGAQGTLAHAGGALVGAGLALLGTMPERPEIGMALTGIGAALITVRAWLRAQGGIPPESS